MSSETVLRSSDTSQEATRLDRLLDRLEEGMVGVMADDAPALKKANALARLASLYLKAYNTAELKRVNAELVERVAELEAGLTDPEYEAAVAMEPATGQPAPEAEGSTVTPRPRNGKASKPKSHGKPRPDRTRPPRPKPRAKPAR